MALANSHDGRDAHCTRPCARRLHVRLLYQFRAYTLSLDDLVRLWNYNPDNQDHTGDDWNGENFSWFSRRRALSGAWLDHAQTSPTLDNGGRILRAIVRPYPAKTAGIPKRFSYEMNTGALEFEWVVPGPSADHESGPSIHTPPVTADAHPEVTNKTTEIYFPSMIAHGRKVVVDGLGQGDRYHYDESRQTLSIEPVELVPGRCYRVFVKVVPPLKEEFTVNSFWDDFGVSISATVVLVLSFLLALFWVWASAGP